MTVVIIDNYDSFTFNLYQLALCTSNKSVEVYRNDQITFEKLKALTPSHVIISPGPGHPANPGDFGVGIQVVTRALELNAPILGVCLGHQGIVHYLGGAVVQAPEIVHGKQSLINIVAPSLILEGMEQQFLAMRYHSLVADESKLPECLTVTAREEALGLIMAVQHKTLPMYGVQFHPESIGTPAGNQLMRNFLSL